METKQPAELTAKIFHDYDGERYAISYRTIKEMMTSIFFLLQNKYEGIEDPHGDNVHVEYADGKFFYWNDIVAHYCFDHGRITKKRAFKLMVKYSTAV